MGESRKIDTTVVKNLDTSLVTIPLEECTPLESNIGILSLTSLGLGIKCVVAAVGDYYYNQKTQDIEKRAAKRKRGDLKH